MYITLNCNTTLLDPAIGKKQRQLAAAEAKKEIKAENKTQTRSEYYGRGYLDPRKLTGITANYHRSTNNKGQTT